MSTVLVTGGAGYIGSHVCKALARAGHLPVTIDNLSEGHRWAVRWGPLVPGDLADPPSLTTVFQRYRPEAVVHLAGRAYVGESMEDPARYYRANLLTSLNLLEAMREARCPHLIFSSTCATFGEPATLPIHETQLQAPVNPYGRSKLMIEWMAADYRTHGIETVPLRYFNAAGADPDGEIGEVHTPEPHLIPRLLEAARGGGTFTVFGNDYPTPDGTCIRDYIHVTDLADAHVRALDWLQQGRPGTAFNLGNGQGFSVRQVIAAAQQVTGCPIAVQYGPRRPGDPPALVGSSGKARSDLGWSPAHADLTTILASAWRWLNRSADPQDITTGVPSP
ncbi:MAG: UDP-glucose 4-epimerase GalE [Magnetococcus sp. WYHC-3]